MSLGKISAFDLAKDNWDLYVERLEQYFIANDVKEAVRVATLITAIGSDAYELMVNLCTPDRPASKTFAQLVTIMKSHLQPQPSILAERFKFRQRKQLKNESVADYVAELKRLSKNCNFGGWLKESLRDQFVCGLNSEVTRQKLFAEDDLSFDRAVKWAVTMEAAKSNAGLVDGRSENRDRCSTTTSVHQMATGGARRERRDGYGGTSAGAPLRGNVGGGGGGGGSSSRSTWRDGGAGGGSSARGTRSAPAAAAAPAPTGSRPPDRARGGTARRQGSCQACGGDHDTITCKFGAYVCRVCYRTGHLKKVCPNLWGSAAARPIASHYFVDEQGLHHSEEDSDEGIFRLSCEHVLRAMRRGRETLLTLLEAFIYDPLVEWGGSGGGGGGARRRRGGRDARAALAMLHVRAAELKHELAENTDQFLAVIPEVKQSFDKWLEENEALKSVEKRLQDCHQQMALIMEIEAYGPNLSSHPLYAISLKYSSYKQAKNALEDSEKAIVKILKDFDMQIENFAETNEVLNGPQLVAWVQEFSGPTEEDEAPILDHIKEFLTNAGQSSMVSQCEQAESELSQCMQQTGALVRACLELLTQHAAVAQYYPRSRTEHHRILLFREWLAAALESRSPDVCREVSAQVNALLAVDNDANNPAVAQQIVAYNYRLQTIHAEANAQLAKAFERLQAEANPDAIAAAQEAYRNAKADISNWVRTEEGASTALECVVVGMLCNLNRRILMLENGAQSAGDCLVDLTSREGEWFLDDMTSLSIQAVELLSLLPIQSASVEDAALPVAVDCVRNVNLLLTDLVQLNFNFSTIILPEALKSLHSEEPSALQLLGELQAVADSTPRGLDDLLQQLEVHLRYLLMDMESPATPSLAAAAALRARYEALLTAPGQPPGRMLLMGLNGLFAAAELRARELAAQLATPTPPAWRKIDHVSEAMHMSAALQSATLRGVLEEVFLVRRVQVTLEVFTQCAALAAAFCGAPGLRPSPDHAALCKPVRRYTAEYVSRCMLGVAPRALAASICLLLRRARLDLRQEVEQKEIGASWSVSLESLCEKARASCGARAALLDRGAALTTALLAAKKRSDTQQRAARGHAHALHAAHCARATLHAHSQLHAEAVCAERACVGLSRRARELRTATERLSAAHARCRTQRAAAHQRVKWGAGANPALAGPLRSLETVWAARAARSAALLAVGVALCAHAQRTAAMRAPHHKHARTTRQALAHWEKACTLAHKYALDVTPVQEALMDMLHPEGGIDMHWVQSVSGLLREMISSLTSRAAALDAARGAPPAAAAAALLPPRAARRPAAAAVAQAAQALAHTNQGSNPAAAYLSRERALEEQLQTVVSAPAHEDGALAAARALLFIQQELPALNELILELPNQLDALGACANARGPTPAPVRPAALARQGGERNAQGAGVWKRVRLKLEGRDPDPARRAPPHEQVEYIISEATNADNLCMMYEGWMAWV